MIIVISTTNLKVIEVQIKVLRRSILFCCKCGSELRLNSKFCSKCGYKVDAIYNKQQNMSQHKKKTFSLGGNKIVFENGMCEYIEVRAQFEKYASKNKVLFIEWYKNTINSFDDFISLPLSKVEELVTNQVKLGIDTLLHFGIDYVDKELLINEIFNNSAIENFFELYINGISEIINKVNHDEEARKYRQELRGHRWHGGGFGFSGAIKGSIKAGMLNVGSRALGTIPEALNKIVTNAEVDSMKSNLMHSNEIYNSLVQGLYSLSCKVFDQVSKYLQYEKKIIDYDETSISKITVAKLHNYMQMFKDGKISKIKTISKISECLNEYPFHLHFYRDLYVLERCLNTELLIIAEYTGSTYEYQLWKNRIDSESSN